MAIELKDIPELPHYVSVAWVAKLFGVSKTAIYYKIYEQEKFREVYRVGGDPDDPKGERERPFLLLRKSEVEKVKKAEDEAKELPPMRLRVNEWNKRVKAWGRLNGFSTVNERGRPNLLLTKAYIESHPDDPRPLRGTA